MNTKFMIKLDEQLARHARNLPERTAIIYHQERISYRQLNQEVNRFANWLISVGIKKGDPVAGLCSKIPQLITVFLGTAKVGAVFTPLNYKLTSSEMEQMLQIAPPKVVVGNYHQINDYYGLIEKLIPKNRCLIIEPPESTPQQLGQFWAGIIGAMPDTVPNIEVSENDTIYLNFTSGTMGTPKAAMTSQTNLFWNTLSSVETLNLTSSDVHLCMFPAYGHPHELFCRSLFLGGTMVLQDYISPKSIAESMSRHNVSALMAPPTFMEILAPTLETNEYDLRRLRIMEAGGMHTADGLANRIEKSIQQSKGVGVQRCYFLPVWGSTETTGIALASPVDNGRPFSSMGKPCKHYAVKIVDEPGKECPPGEVGEMYIRGPAVVSGYYGNSQETQRAFKDGWYHTGDLVKRDNQGYFYFVSRRAGLMKVAGMKVYPLEIDTILSRHPKIKEAVTVSAQDKIRGEIPLAVIVVQPGETVTPDEIKRFCRDYLADYKIPRLFEFWSELPKTASGKLDLRAVKKRVKTR
ncbi:MAG: class I adenylate-forming enzyme family protein [bacterium]|nr:class I adenylate-forming enzyme family protein [bacterium]